MSKWTLEKIYNCEKIKRGGLFDDGNLGVDGKPEDKCWPLSVVMEKGVKSFEFTYDGNELFIDYDDEAVEDYKFYDQNMNLVEPPKEREYHIVTEYMNRVSGVICLLTDDIMDINPLEYIELPNGRKYKRYRDNGELEVIDESN
ncbi:hypothetical protein [Kangiella sp.]|uniref:hypothetical protein n=1 Tax=Kangiella sp. TaxID=1920245 RepID=UPI003A8E5BB7